MGAPGRTSADEVRLAVALGPAEIEHVAQRAEIVEGRAEKRDLGRPHLFLSMPPGGLEPRTPGFGNLIR